MEALLSQDAKDWREGRRLRAYELAQQGWTQKAIAQALGVTAGAVSRWMARARTGGGPQALARRCAPSAPPKLTREQKAGLSELVRRGAPAFGFTGDVWTARRVAAVIGREWHVAYHPGTVARLLHACGGSRQKPARRARQRDEATVQQWQDVRPPALKKRPWTRRARGCSWTRAPSTCCRA